MRGAWLPPAAGLLLLLAALAAAALSGRGPGREAPAAHPPAVAPAAAAVAPAAPAPAPPAAGTPEPAPTPGPTPAPTPLTARAEVLAAYHAYWELYAEALRELDPGRLGEVAAGPHLERARAEIEELRARGTAARIEVEHGVLAVEVDEEAGRASVLDAYLNRSRLLDAESGEPVGRAPRAVRVTDGYLLVREGERWKVWDGFRSGR